MNAQIKHYQNLVPFIEQAMIGFGGKPAFTCLGQTLNYQQINEKANQLAAYLQSLGLNEGDRIVIQLPNLIQYPIAMYAAIKIGLVVVNTNPLYTAQEMLHQFNDSGARAIILLADLCAKLESILKQTAIEHIIVTQATDLLGGDMQTGFTIGVPFNQALELGKGQDYRASSAQLHDTLLLQYTGGTTGVSKGAQLSHYNLIANALQCIGVLDEHCREGQETFVCPLPLYHIYAFMIAMVLFVHRGNHIILIPNPRDIEAFVAAIRPFRFTGFAGLNTLFVALCHQAEFRELDFSQLKLTLSGGTTLTTTAAKAWLDVTGCNIAEGYGLSETSPVVTLNKPGAEQIGTVGKVLDGTDVLFLDERDNPVADGETGQLAVKGPQVMQGYWNMSGETAKVMTADGYFKTGDIGLRQADGFIRIVDRLKDIIIVSGFNVYPNEIEDVLVKHPAVLEAAVIGEADERSGEAVHAYVTLKKASDENTLIAFCRKYLTAYKIPKKVTFMSALPKSSVGKILRRELRKKV